MAAAGTAVQVNYGTIKCFSTAGNNKESLQKNHLLYLQESRGDEEGGGVKQEVIRDRK